MYRNEIIYKFGINMGICQKAKIFDVDEDKFEVEEEEYINNIDENSEEETFQ